MRALWVTGAVAVGILIGYLSVDAASAAKSGLVEPSASAISESSGPVAHRATRTQTNSTIAPPKFVAKKTAYSLDPADVNYDGMKLMILQSLRETYAVEPRNEQWAAAMERHVGGQFADDLKQLTGLTVTSFKCRTQACELKLDIPAVHNKREVRKTMIKVADVMSSFYDPHGKQYIRDGVLVMFERGADASSISAKRADTLAFAHKHDWVPRRLKRYGYTSEQVRGLAR